MRNLCPLFISGRNCKGVYMDEVDSRTRKWMLQSAAKKLLPDEKRLQGCLCWPVSGADQVELWVSHQYHRAHLKGLQTCGSPWLCSPCSQKITERRRCELTQAMDHTDYQFALVTYTLRHAAKDDLGALLSDLR